MPIYVLQKKFGIAVVVADHQDGAFQFLKAYEKEDEYLMCGTTPADFKEIKAETSSGVVAYIAE